MNALQLLEFAWKDKEGYVAFSTLDRQTMSWRDLPLLKWPDQRDSIKEILGKAKDSTQEVYWCPNVFNVKRRDATQALPSDLVWADLDGVDYTQLPAELTPSAIWATSDAENHYQALWRLPQLYDSDIRDQIGKGLTYKIGADHAGWDATQVLRIPGTRNHKYDHTPRVRMISMNGAHLDTSTVLRLAAYAPPIVQAQELEDLPDAETVLKQYRRRIPASARTLLRAREKDVVVGQRSERLWYLIRLLAEGGLTVPEIVAVVRGSVWNKFAGRADEVRRLSIEAQKATALQSGGSKEPRSVTASTAHANGHAQDMSAVEEVEGDEDEPRLETWSEFDSDHRPIQWLVADVWGESEVGFISGLPKSYKSWLALDLAVSVATGTRFLGSFAAYKRNVLLIQEEDPRVVMQDRLAKIAHAKGCIGVDDIEGDPDSLAFWYHLPDTLHIISNQGFSVTDEDWMEWLAERVEELDVSLIIIDPLMMTADIADEFKAFEVMGKVLKPLKKLRTRTQAAIVVVHHHTKGSETGDARSMYGSVALWAWEEAALHLTVKGPGQIVADRFSKHSQLTPLSIEIGDLEDYWVPKVREGSVDVDLPGLIQLGGGLTINDLMNSTGLRREVLSRDLQDLEKRGEIKRERGPARPGQSGRRPIVWVSAKGGLQQ